MENKIINFIKDQIDESINTKKNILIDNDMLILISEISQKIINAYKNNFKTILAGNGGSAADSQHIAAEFVSRFYFDRDALPSISLTTDTSILTAIGNDYSFDNIFKRQIQAIGNEGDIFIAISTSGNSKNILEAIKECKKKNIITIGLTGKKGGLMSDLCDYIVKVPSSDTPRIQESHILIGHILCSIVEETLFGNKGL
tara:strand:+ start:5394 stop:5993 length:600 start_codon:yes stop_codon:yes gene_type:complete